MNALLHRAWCAQVLAAQDHKAASQDEEGDQGISGDTTIKTGTLVVEAQWYLSTSDSQDRKSYKLQSDETVTVPVASLVQEHDLQWKRDFRAPDAELTLSNESHVRLMQHNYSNTK